ncbi:hypothetical protein JCM16303_001028 [Sporobolomyces ruberrimus]
MPQAPQTILALASEPVPALGSISLLPCSLAFDGPAPISTYFHPRSYTPPDAPSSSSASEEHRQAAFRGRRLISTFMPVPQGYKGLVFSTRAAVPPTRTQDKMEEELEAIQAEKTRKAREERASKRAKVSIDEPRPEDGTRRSPRKAAREARERAIKAAKEKAKGKGKVAKKFSLDDSETEEEEEVQQEQEEVGDLEGEKIEPELGAGGEAQLEAPKMEIDEISTTTALVEEAVEDGAAAEVLTTTTTTSMITDATVVIDRAPADSTDSSNSTSVPAPAPLLSRTSTSLSTHLHLPTTPSVTSSSQEPTYALHEPTPTVELARDEKHLRPCSTFDRIEVWNPDFMVPGGRVTEEDEVARSIQEWIGLANKIHAY